MNGQQILAWVKANFVIVIFCVLILAALIVLPIVSSGMQAGVKEQASKREQKDKELAQLGSTTIGLNDPTPGAPRVEQTSALINPQTSNAFKTYAKTRTEDAEQVLQTAIEFNRKGRGVLVAEFFPKPPRYRRDELLLDFSRQLQLAYESLLSRIKAGQAPTLSDMKDKLLRQQRQFVDVTLAKQSGSELSPEEQAQLQQELSKRRLGLLQEAANNFKIYASIDELNVPSWSMGQSIPSAAEVFRWQWDFWAIQDVFMAIAAANEDASNVMNAPVKRIVEISVTDETIGPVARSEERTSGSSGGAAPPPGGGDGGPKLGGGGGSIGGGGIGGGPGMIGRGGTGNNRGQDPAKNSVVAQPINPSAEVARNYHASLTGRASNALYDVRLVRVHLIVESDEVYDVLDAFGTRNFMTVVGLEFWPNDPFADIEEGFVYGSDSTSHVVLDIETVWLRTWTSEFMPDEVKLARGVPIESKDETAQPDAE